MTRRVVPAAAGIPGLEPIAQDLYDTKLYPVLGTGILTFFQNPAVGSERETNMVASGQLPYPKQFHAFGIAVEMFPAYTEADTVGTLEAFAAEKQKLREHAYLVLTIGSKDYLTLPLVRVPEGVGGTGAIAGGVLANTYVLTHGVPDIKHAFELTVPQQGKIKPIHIPAQQSFKVDIRWPNILLLTSAVEGIKVRVYLVGVLWREVQ